MKQLLSVLIAVFVSFVAIGLTVGEAEAGRLGGGRSFGMQRQSVAPRPAAPQRQATPTNPAPATPAPAQTPRRSWLGPLAGLAAGLGLGALMSHFGLGEEFGGILMLAMLVMGAVFVFRLLMRRSTPAREPLQYAGMNREPAFEQTEPQAFAGSPQASATIPAGFDADAFLRVAKLNFVRMQAANDAKNLDDLREFVTPEVFAEIKMQMDERGNAKQQTDVVTLNADLLEVATEGQRHVASVRFSGMIREADGAPAVAFDEIWNLAKPVDGSRGWAVAGIQQIN